MNINTYVNNIERGRYCHPIIHRNDRICNFCTLGQLDDEKHFLMTCEFHSIERHSLFKAIIPILGLDKQADTCTNVLFQSIIGSKENTCSVRQALAKFVFGGFQKRDKLQIFSS